MKRKYAKSVEDHPRYECTRWNCKWQGTDDEKELRRYDKYNYELVCPQCGNNNFHELLDEEEDNKR